MFKTRLLSGIVLVILALIFLTAGGPVLLAGMGVISLIGMFELYRIFHVEKSLLGIVGYVAAVCYYVYLYLIGDRLSPMVLVMAFLILLLAVYVFTYPKYRADQVMAVFFGLFYVAVMLSYIYQTRCIPTGEYLVWLFSCAAGGVIPAPIVSECLLAGIKCRRS